MQIEIEGTITKVLELRTGTSSRTGNAWQRQDYVIETPGQYPRRCLFTVADGNIEGIIPPGEEGKLSFVFDTNKNVGYVHHTIRIYGNIAPNGVAQMTFDCNVVPPTNSSVDYEENYYERNAREIAIRGMIEGGQGQKGYFTDEGISDRKYDRYFLHNAPKK